MRHGATYPPADPEGMRDFEIDDRFWKDALNALAGGSRASALAARHPEYAALLGELESEAETDSLLIGVRLSAAGHNGRLLALLTASFLARAGARALLVDLSPDVRWLERLLGEDLKEGIVDHTHYGVPLERCVRDTALGGLSVLTGGSAFLTGSPLDDAPALRGALDRLRQRHSAVVVTLPDAEGAADRAGLVALCDALLAVEEEGSAPLAGSERAVIRLTGDVEAADELARLTHRFVGPLPALLAREEAPGRSSAPRSGSGLPTAPAWEEADVAGPAPREPGRVPVGGVGPSNEDEDLAFLTAFEEGEPAADREWDRPTAPSRFRDESPPGPRRRARSRGGRRLATAGAVAVLLAAVIGAVRLFAPAVTAWLEGGEGRMEGSLSDVGLGEDPIGFDGTGKADEPGTVVSLEPAEVSGEESRAGAEPAPGAPGSAEPDRATASPPDVAGRPAPYSLHLGSYRGEESAGEVADRLAQAGYAAFLAPVSLPGKGRWQRVYVGTFADSTVARGILEEILAQDLVSEGAVRATPWTFALGTAPSLDEAEARIRELRARGIWAYAVGANPVRIYAGAFASPEEADLLARALDETTETVTLTQREL